MAAVVQVVLFVAPAARALEHQFLNGGNSLITAKDGVFHQPESAATALARSETKAGGSVLRWEVWPGLLMASLAGASTVLGATVVLFMPEGGPPPSAMAFAFSLAAGVMVAISAEMLWPHYHEGEHELHFSWMPFLVFSCGAICCALLCKLGDCLGWSASADEKMELPNESDPKSFRLAALLFVSLTLHNFPEGFAVAVSAVSGMRLGVTMCIAVAFHNIPEGIALAVSVHRVTKSVGQSFLWTFVSGLTEPLGAVCAMLVLQSYMSTPGLLDTLLTAVAGVMCYVALAELLPEAVSTRCWGSIGFGFSSGVAVMVLTHLVMDAAIDDSGNLVS